MNNQCCEAKIPHQFKWNKFVYLIKNYFYQKKEIYGLKLFRFLFRKKHSNLIRHAEYEMKLAGLDKEDSDYSGMLYEAILDLIILFSSQGHSGYSAMRTIQLFKKLANFENLLPLTNNPDEWIKLCDNEYQNKRNSACFSKDLITYYNIEDKERKEINLRSEKSNG